MASRSRRVEAGIRPKQDDTSRTVASGVAHSSRRVSSKPADKGARAGAGRQAWSAGSQRSGSRLERCDTLAH